MKLSINTLKGKYTYKYVPIFLGIKPIDKAIAKENLLLLKDILDKNHLRFLLLFGTLLGAVREHDFIAHDEDIDLVMKKEDMPAWFKNGMLAAVLAPTALNQQRFFIDIDGEDAVITARRFPLAKIDLGIVRYNFEAASGHKCRPK
jgi:hypothetical protein